MDCTLSALLRACKDDPSDVRRLVLADWFDDHGDSDRAEFVRLQVALADLWGDEPDSVEPEYRRDFLLRRNRQRWFGPAAQWYATVRFHRGLIEIEVTAEQLREHPPEDLPDEVLGWVDSLEIANPQDGAPGLAELLDSPVLQHFSRINLSCNYRTPDDHRFGDAEAIRLAANPHLQHVRALSLRYSLLHASGAAALARCERLAGLRELDLGASWIDDGAARTLAQADWLGSLVRLNLATTTRLSAGGMAALLRSTSLESLTHLNLEDVEMDETVARALSESPHLASLEWLSLERAEINLKPLRLLANSPHLRLGTLELDNAEFGDDGARVLARGKLLGRVKALHLSGNGLTDAGAVAL